MKFNNFYLSRKNLLLIILFTVSITLFIFFNKSESEKVNDSILGMQSISMEKVNSFTDICYSFNMKASELKNDEGEVIDVICSPFYNDVVSLHGETHHAMQVIPDNIHSMYYSVRGILKSGKTYVDPYDGHEKMSLTSIKNLVNSCYDNGYSDYGLQVFVDKYQPFVHRRHDVNVFCLDKDGFSYLSV